MLNPLENYFIDKPEPHQSCMICLRAWLKEQGLTELYKFSTAFFHYKDKMFCYMSVSAKGKKLYLGFVKGHQMKHASLKKEGRKQIKVIYLDPEVDLPIKMLNEIVKMAKKLY